MSTENRFKHYVVLNATDNRELRQEYSRNNEEWIARYIAERAFRTQRPQNFHVTDLPSNRIGEATERPSAETPGGLAALIVALEIDDPRIVDRLVEAANTRDRSIFLGSSPDLPFDTVDHWCPREAADPIFADRAAAELLMGVDFLKRQNGTKRNGKTVVTTGQNVQVVIVDQGLDASLIPAKNFGGGWPVDGKAPGSTGSTPGKIGRTHGMMIAQNILAIAPDVKLFDLPMAPRRISKIKEFFLSTANAAYVEMLAAIAAYRAGQYPGPWILVNPWGIYDTSSEHPKGWYTDNPTNFFNWLVTQAAGSGIDVVFAAGNCGQFCPDSRCGTGDTGPQHSIWGANSLEDVLTVGAVRADEMWLGYSSQGPGQPNLAYDKPDLCAASQFCENADAFTANTGTSAACAMAAGVLAALRSNGDWGAITPARMKQVLNDTARTPAGLQTSTGLRQRLGNGIMDAEAAFNALP